jgi:acyl carrier protein
MTSEARGVSSAADLSTVLEEWGIVLGKGVAVDDNFFAIGGDSLRAIDVADRIRQRLEVPLEYTDVFDHPTPSALAALVGDLRQDGR